MEPCRERRSPAVTLWLILGSFPAGCPALTIQCSPTARLEGRAAMMLTAWRASPVLCTSPTASVSVSISVSVSALRLTFVWQRKSPRQSVRRKPN